MKPDPSRPKVTVEDLLRVKRAEQPPAEFWVRFEQELRAKQLAAIVERRPWWHAASRTLAGMARWQLPLGATAVLAITVFTVRTYREPAVVRQEAGAASLAPAKATALFAETGSAFSAPAVTPPAIAGSVASASPAASESLVASNVRPGEISRVISMLDVDPRADEMARTPTPSARLIASNLASAQMSEADPVALSLGSARGFETRGLPAARPSDAEPLAQVSTPKFRTSARYLTTALPAGYVFETAAARPSEPVRSRVSDRLLRDDSVSRVGVDNGGVFWKL